MVVSTWGLTARVRPGGAEDPALVAGFFASIVRTRRRSGRPQPDPSPAPNGAQRRFLQQKGCEAPASCVSSTLMEHPLRAKQRLAAVLLGEPLEQWVTARRPHTAWVTLASELYEALDGELSISHESLRLWYGPAEKAA